MNSDMNETKVYEMLRSPGQESCRGWPDRGPICENELVPRKWSGDILSARIWSDSIPATIGI